MMNLWRVTSVLSFFGICDTNSKAGVRGPADPPLILWWRLGGNAATVPCPGRIVGLDWISHDFAIVQSKGLVDGRRAHNRSSDSWRGQKVKYDLFRL